MKKVLLVSVFGSLVVMSGNFATGAFPLMLEALTPLQYAFHTVGVLLLGGALAWASINPSGASNSDRQR